MTRPRLLSCLLALALAAPSSAFAQGAGNDQYQDPFGDEPAQNDGGGMGGAGSGSGDGLSRTPPGSTGTGAPDPAGTTTTPQTTTTAPAAATGRQLPNTGSDPRELALVGLVLLMFGVGMRLRTIDPDAY